jgi:hypothetical protein
MLKDIKFLLSELANEDEMYHDIAVMHRKLFKALQNQGFTSDEAIRIIESQGMKIGS